MPKKRIKIIHIIGRLDYGGAERLLLDICRKLDKSVFDVSVLALQGTGRLEQKFVEAGISVETLNKKQRFNLSFINKVKVFLEAEKPDIVHTHLFVADFYGGQAALRAKVPVIISTKHDVLSLGFWRDIWSKYLHKKFTKIVAISNATRDYLMKKEKLDFEQIEVIYNGIDVQKYYQEGKLFFDEIVNLGSVGRLSKEKGHKHLIRACRFLKTKDWHLTLVGDGPLRKELEKSAKMLDLQDKIEFVGEVADVRPYLEKMDIFVLPSVSEGLSLAIIEAAMAGKFIIATNVGGVPEIIRHKQTGLLFRPKNIEQLVRQLNWAIENKADVKNMARQLQKEVVEKFDINKIIFQYQDLYSKLRKK